MQRLITVLIVSAGLSSAVLAQTTLPAAAPIATPNAGAMIDAPIDAPTLYARTAPSLVAVQYIWESELGRREVVGPGVVVSDTGVVMAPLAMFDMRIPDAQMKEFKLLIPSDTQDVQEIDATFLGRDERSDVAFLKATAPRKWSPVKFVQRDMNVGDAIWSVGMLPKLAGYKPYIVDAKVSAKLRGEMPQIMVSGTLAAVGSPVFNASGEATGWVISQSEQTFLLNEARLGLSSVLRPPVVFVPTSAFAESLAHPPAGKPLALPWMGVLQLVGVNKEVADYFGLKNQTALQIGDIIPGGPAERAGFKAGEIITRINGQPIERGDEPEELPLIVRRQIMRMNVGDRVGFTVVDPRSHKPRELVMVLEERPKQANLAQRFFAEDLGFAVREMVFMDSYARHLPGDSKGVIVAMVRPQSAAQTARMEGNDLVVDLNGEKVTDLAPFKKAFEKFRTDHPKEAVVLVVLRDGKNLTIRIEPPQ